MKRAPLRRISVTTAREAEDAVAVWLGTMFGQPASAYYEIESGRSTITIYLPAQPPLPRNVRKQIAAGLKQIRSCGLKTAPGEIKIAPVRRKDWADSWKRHFKAIEIFHGKARPGPRPPANSLLIKPSWSNRKPRKGQAVIVLDPGLSFGTGHHPTTAFCLGEIVRNADGSAADLLSCSTRTSRPRPSLLDLGTGAGILAIAAAKLGYAPVRALDFDPEAVRVARANARANRVTQKLKILYGDVTKLPVCPRQPGHGYDLVCANLTSDLLIAERGRITAQLNRSGTLVLAGVLKREFAAVQKAYEALGLKLTASRSETEWRSGSFCFGR